MKGKFPVLILLMMVACHEKENHQAANAIRPDTVIMHDTVFTDQVNDWQKGFALTHEPEADSVWFKPVQIYISNPQCSGLAIDFYYGHLRPSDNGTTDELLKLAVSSDNTLRPFYRWCLNKTIQVSDGALAEHVGEPARHYAEKYPEEFFSYMAEDSTGKRYGDWTEAIGYSGYYEKEDYRNTGEIRNHMIAKMKKNCSGCDGTMMMRIEKLAKDCFN